MVTAPSSDHARPCGIPLLRWTAFACVFVMLLMPFGITTTASEDAAMNGPFRPHAADSWGEYPAPPLPANVQAAADANQSET